MNLEFLRLPFSKSVAVRLFANMHVCISVHTTKMTAILEKVSILNFLLAIQFFQKVALTEAYFLYHYLKTVAMNMGQEWQSSWKMVSILNFYWPLPSGPSSLWTAPCRGGEACVLQWTDIWLFDRNAGHLENGCPPEILSGTYLFPKECSLKNISA